MTVIAPFVLSEGAGTPYVTIDEVKFSPTAAALDFSNLVENASQAVQDRALHDLIVRASDMADRHVYGALGTLTATVNTGNGRYRQNRYGQFIIHPDYWPILEVRSFSAGINPGTQNAYSLTSSNVSIEREQFIITAQAGLSNITTTYGSLGIVGYNQGVDIQQFCQWTYVNGFGNTFLSAAVSAGNPIFQWGEGGRNGGTDIEVVSYYPRLLTGTSVTQIYSSIRVTVAEELIGY